MRIITAILLLICTSPVYAAIALGGTTRVALFGGGTTASDVSPNVTGTNLVATVSIGTLSGGTANITWGGVNMTRVPGAYAVRGSLTVDTYYLINPPTGVSTVTINAASAWTTVFADAKYYTGADQTSPIDSINNSISSGTATSISGALNPSQTGEMVVSTSMNGAGCTIPTYNTGTGDEGGCDGSVSWASGHNLLSASGATTDTYSIGSAVAWAYSGVTVKAASTSTPTYDACFFGGGV